MQFIKPPVSTLCLGQAASMGAVLLRRAQKGRRYALPHSRIMIHQPLGGAQGQASRSRNPGAGDFAHARGTQQHHHAHTGQNLRKIEKDTDRDYVHVAASRRLNTD